MCASKVASLTHKSTSYVHPTLFDGVWSAIHLSISVHFWKFVSHVVKLTPFYAHVVVLFCVCVWACVDMYLCLYECVRCKEKKRVTNVLLHKVCCYLIKHCLKKKGGTGQWLEDKKERNRGTRIIIILSLFGHSHNLFWRQKSFFDAFESVIFCEEAFSSTFYRRKLWARASSKF